MNSISNKVNQLKGMFPDMDQAILAAVLTEKKDDVDAAIEALLAMNGTELSAKEKQDLRTRQFDEVVRKVIRMPSDSEATRLAGVYNLNIQTVSWEDCARSKGSAWGPCISDMTLMVGKNALPVIRHPNFEDLTWDVPMEKIPLVVGNEIGGTLYTVTLKEYLEHFRMYLQKPDDWKGDQTSLLAPSRDSHVIMSSQACFLPVPLGAEAEFNVAIYNYQTRPGDPAVLAITASAAGTSAQIVDSCGSSGWGGQKLYFNKNGQRASYVGQRLSDNRRERGVAVEGEMSREEKQQNMIMIIQVPLKQREVHKRRAYMEDLLFCASAENKQCESLMMDCSASMPAERSRRREKADVEEAIIKIGETDGTFREIGGVEIERDPRFPVRVTLQFYKSTANGVVDDAAIQTIAGQIESSRRNADFVGSLVVGGRTNRPTEHKVHTSPRPIVTPPWWTPFWLTYKSRFSSLSEHRAKERVFEGGRFANSSLDDNLKSRVLSILGGGDDFIVPPYQPPVVWDVLGGDSDVAEE